MKRMGSAMLTAARRGVHHPLHFVMLILCAVSFFIWITGYWAEYTLAWSRPAYVVGFSSDGDACFAYQGVRYMPNRDGDGFICKLGFSPVWPMDRMGGFDGLTFRVQAWGTEYNGVALESWKVFAICALILGRRPLGEMELKFRAQLLRSRGHA